MAPRPTSMITSRQHPIVKEFRALARSAGPLMLLDGWHLLAEAAAARVAVKTIALCGPPTAREQSLIDALRRTGTQVVEVSGSVLNAVSPVNAPTGVVASALIPEVTSADVLSPAPALVLAAAGLQDPGNAGARTSAGAGGNAGAIIRSAAAAGATGVVLDELSADPWGWKALRASMGAAFHLPVVRSSALSGLAAEWRRSGVRLVATVPRAGLSMYDVDFMLPTAVLLGGEGPGLPQELIDAADLKVSIPMHGAIESLNAAVASALVLYEARRQRGVRA